MTDSAPITSAERIGELDILRGFALLGVFVVHFVGGVFHNIPTDEVWQAAQRADPLQYSVLLFSDFAFLDKANTLFATLFGMGFWVMMERLKARGVAFEKIYFRRLIVLMAIGLINVFMIFPGDVLHQYAALGLLLLLLHRAPRTFLLVGGLALAIGGYALGNLILPDADDGWVYFAAVEATAIDKAEYWNWVFKTSEAFLVRIFVYGTAVGWLFYLFGRFLIGAWIMQQGWMDRLEELLPQIRRITTLVLPLGMALSAIAVALYEEALTGPEELKEWVQMVAAPLHALGYALVLILLFHSRWRSLVMFFAPVGRMALSAYVAHGAVLTIVYMPFGLGMAGKLGPAPSLALVLSLYAAMTLACSWWLARFAYGPLEYVWRWATYGKMPAHFRLPNSSPAATSSL